MDWLKELLKKLGLDESKLDSAVSEINKELPKHYMPKDKYNEVVEAKKKAEADIAQRDKQIEELGKTAGASEELKKQIETLQGENKAAKEKYESELKDLQLNTAIKSALAEAKAKHPDLLTSKIDKSKLVLDGDKVVGLDDQIKPLKETYKELFETESQQPQKPGFQFGAPPAPGTPPATPSLKDAIAAHFQTKS